MSDKALREELDHTVERVIKKLDSKTLVEGFPEVFYRSGQSFYLIIDIWSGYQQRVPHGAPPADAEPSETSTAADYREPDGA